MKLIPILVALGGIELLTSDNFNSFLRHRWAVLHFDRTSICWSYYSDLFLYQNKQFIGNIIMATSVMEFVILDSHSTS